MIRVLYGEDIPPATLLLAFGKPTAGGDIYPPAIAGEMAGYWTQRPGYTVDERELRAVLYDAVYARHTRGQGEARYAALSGDDTRWRQSQIIGLGERIGGFWHPTPENVYEN
jgi:hypothetical protein